MENIAEVHVAMKHDLGGGGI
ncbi:hypothetical protein CBM2634_U320005 [Cupriavidus taiwanensis]|uniref:Uncharacterized protein n=1 Tax=Cupriavidus taiwanensis TaxID=164546 RepID=A0A375JCA5_9BURK|nr:hypothetical protein CBM2634_U320005 [Cupriavidus taiwanensis]